MRKSNPVIQIIFALVCGIAPFSTHAQGEFEKGYLPDQAYHISEIDSVNLATQNVTVDIPLLSYPQRGSLPDLRIFVVASSRTWTPIPCCNKQGFIWQPTSPTIPAEAPDPHVDTSIDTAIKQYRLSDVTGTFFSYHIVEPTGASHLLGWTSSSTMESIDGSGYTVQGPLPTASTTYDKRGNCFDGTCDPNGNKITLNGTSYVDSIGRTVPIVPYLTCPISLRTESYDV
jgi:hypothetical protein